MRRQEILALTGIRFYAALFVYLSHIVVVPGMDTFTRGHVFFDAGVVGVSFFFVLSGFILTYNYADSFRNGVSGAGYKKFVWDRLTKIYPVHLATLLLEAPMSILSPNRPFLWGALPFHLLLLQCFWPSTTPAFYNYLNIPSWSISCEWFFYLLAPMTILFALGSTRRKTLLIGVTAIYAAGLGWILWQAQSDATRLHFVSWFAPSRFPEFLVGVLLSGFYLSRTATNARWASAAQAAGVVLIVAGAVSRPSAPWPFWGGLLYVPGSALLILGLASGRGFLVDHLSRPWVTRLGMASFSLYLVHGPILRYAKNFYHLFGWTVQSWVGFLATAIGLFVVAQTTALLMFEWYEMPVQKRLRKMLSPSDRGAMPGYSGHEHIAAQRVSERTSAQP